MSEITLTMSNFENEVLKSDKTVLVDFWASWCGPCRMIAPVLTEIAEDYGDSVKVGKVNVDEQPELAGSFGIESIPTIMVFKNGELTERVVGYKPKEELEKLL